MKALGIDSGIVNDCVNKSFEEVGNLESKNQLLEQDSLTQEDLGIFMHPSLSINSLTYRGYLEGQDVFDAICSTFSKRPSVCTDPFNEELALDFSSNAGVVVDKRTEDRTMVRKVVVWGILVLLLVAQLTFFLWYRIKK